METISIEKCAVIKLSEYEVRLLRNTLSSYNSMTTVVTSEVQELERQFAFLYKSM